MITISIANGSKKFYGNLVLDNLNISLNDRDKIAIIGENGSGKSTLLSLLSGSEELSAGTYSKAKETKIAYLNQHIDLSESNLTSIDYLKLEYQELFDIETRMRKLEVQMETDPSDTVFNKYGLALEQYNKLGGYEYESIIYKTAVNFELTTADLERKVADLSFGEMKILEFVRLLLCEPDVLLLDEPTNHLDYKKVAILEQFLSKYKGTIIFVSHDRYFIDQISDSIWHLENHELTEYSGNYSYFIAQYKILFQQLTAEYNQQQLEIKRIKEQIQRYKIWGVKNEKFLTMASRLKKKLDELPELKKPTIKKKQFDNLGTFQPKRKIALKFTDYNLAIGNQTILQNFSEEIYIGDIVHIIGENGAGKSTLIKALDSDFGLEKDNLKFHINTKMQYIPQEIVYSNPDDTVLKYCEGFANQNTAAVRSLLAKYDFKGDIVNHKLHTLSGGQRVRLELIKVFTGDYNLLLLDEPTNHLDIDTKEMLENFILSFEGTVLFISHDRYFSNKITNKQLILKDQTINKIN
ncbi:ABC-F family ATP-binding cassette domain-containing protein [Mollicutes bacterium LVI A0039]|nr:ABC-F family ATP-binding cassette domain-containing protein [Mollicutes bacterium LVI A0039]